MSVWYTKMFQSLKSGKERFWLKCWPQELTTRRSIRDWDGIHLQFTAQQTKYRIRKLGWLLKKPTAAGIIKRLFRLFKEQIAGEDKHQKMSQIGADILLGRSADLIAELGEHSVDVVIDNVAGSGFPTMLKLLKRGGRLVSSGAIAGPIVDLDMRDMYLKDITLMGTTAWDEAVFPNIIRYIEQGEIKPILAQTFPLSSIAEAQKEFLEKKHVGKFVLIP